MARIGALGILLAVLLGAAGCGGAVDSTAIPTQALVPSTATPHPVATDEPPTATPSELQTEVEPEVAGGAQVATGAVVADLAAALAVPSEQITIRSVTEVLWPGVALSCDTGPQVADDGTPEASPEAGVPGFRIILLYGEDAYSYHTDEAGRFMSCPGDVSETDIAGEPLILDTLLGSVVDVARRDLARRLDLPARRVFLVEAYPLQWPDTSLGCLLDETGTVEPTPVPGYRIVFEVGPELYEYHSDTRRPVLCPSDAVRLPVTPTLSPTPTEEPEATAEAATSGDSGE